MMPSCKGHEEQKIKYSLCFQPCINMGNEAMVRKTNQQCQGSGKILRYFPPSFLCSAICLYYSYN